MSSDSEIDRQMSKMHQEIATHNSKVAVKVSGETRTELLDRVDKMAMAIHDLTFKVQHLEQKYNLLLSERFNTGPTERGSDG